jgi:DNA recombination protein RmuC
MRVISRRKLQSLKSEFKMQRASEQALVDDQLDHLGSAFSALSQQALRQNNESFLTLAKQSFEQLRNSAASDLQAREQSFANLVKPIEQAIRETDAQLKTFDTRRQVGDAKLAEHINNLLASQHSLQVETRNLVTALRRPEVRGQWGELTLKRVVELAGMSELYRASISLHGARSNTTRYADSFAQ